MKYKWKVMERPTGRYSSFERRGFPHAYYNDKNESPAAFIGSEIEYEDYVPKKIEYQSLILRFADHSQTPWKWRKIIKDIRQFRNVKMLSKEC